MWACEPLLTRVEDRAEHQMSPTALYLVSLSLKRKHHFGQTACLCPSSAGVTGTGGHAQLLTCGCELHFQVFMRARHPRWINTHCACLSSLLSPGSLTLPNGPNFPSVLSSLWTNLPQAG